MQSFASALGVSLALSLAAQPAAAQSRPTTILARAGGSVAERSVDVGRCEQVAGRAPASDLPREGGQASAMGYGGYYGSAEGAIGSAIAMLIIGAIETDRARGQAAKFCLSNLGYAEVPLTANEAAQFRGLRGDAKLEWENAFLASANDRIAALRTSVVPELPAYLAAPATQGGLRFDLASMSVAPDPVAPGAVLASGRASHWRTAEVVEPFRYVWEGLTLVAEPGAVFHQVDYRPQTEPLLRDQGATWCGPVIETTQGSTSTQVWCFTYQRAGYTVFRPTGYAWQAGPYRDGIALAAVQAPLKLREREPADLDLAFEIRASEMNSSRLVLEGVVRNGSRSVVLWRQQFALRPGGNLTLPLWTHRLRVSRDRSTITAVLDDQGDGSGLRD